MSHHKESLITTTHEEEQPPPPYESVSLTDRLESPPMPAAVAYTSNHTSAVSGQYASEPIYQSHSTSRRPGLLGILRSIITSVVDKRQQASRMVTEGNVTTAIPPVNPESVGDSVSTCPTRRCQRKCRRQQRKADRRQHRQARRHRRYCTHHT
ncbi:uncharacterized protein BYT42DRAFT_573914 [Radiomyces spectabilis]|uniref:uncharacterized protein n=1 Tax=Radiomyces spectabilis TaxID=64574 RepID=UPI00221EEF34|nr:uncharacterized protein BYT42DRAFT_573914 [Radiomyces spectabilis]KAI8376242.1 hypothetical protein BYT42DRAFT_573914 [Radiomyces spectabilis]